MSLSIDSKQEADNSWETFEFIEQELCELKDVCIDLIKTHAQQDKYIEERDDLRKLV